MTTTETATSTTTGFVTVGDAEIWFEQRGEGPDVLLIGGLTDPVESWEFQLAGLSDRYRVTAFDNRGAGRSPGVPDGFTVADMADDAVGVLRALGIESAHVAGFSGGSLNTQQVAVRHPDLVRSIVLMGTWARPDAFSSSVLNTFTWLPAAAPDERAMLEAFFLWIYTARAHNEGMVAQVIEEALVYPHPQSLEEFGRQLQTWAAYDGSDEISAIDVPALVIAGGLDMVVRPEAGRRVADLIPGAEFLLLPEEAHQPFQERPDEWNAIVHDFWTRVEASR